MNTTTPLIFSQEELEKSTTYQRSISKYSDVVLTHNCYYDSKEPYQTWIVVTKQESNQLYSITRFWKSFFNDKIMHSFDYIDKTAEDVFKLLLSDYSTGLKN